MSQAHLKHDLRERTRERLGVVLSDTFDLYDMAELGDEAAAHVLCELLLAALASVAALTKIESNELGKYLAYRVSCARAHVDKH